MADLSSALPVRFGANVTTSGTITMTSTSNALTIDSDSLTTLTAEVPVGTAAGGGILVIEATIDDTNWFAIDAFLISSGATPATATARSTIRGAAGLPVASLPARVLIPGIASYSQVRFRVGTTGTGTTGTIFLSGSYIASAIMLGPTYQEDDPHTTGDLGFMQLGVRINAGTGTSGASSDYVPNTYDLDGKLWTSGDVIDNDASNVYTLGTDSTKVIGGFAVATNANPGTAITAGRAGAVAVSPNRELFMILRDAAGNGRAANVDANNRLQVAVGGVLAGDLGKAEDAAHTTGDTGVMGLFIRQASTPTDKSAGNTDGDYEPGQVDAQGSIYVNAAINSRTDAARKIIIKTQSALAAATATTTGLDNTVTTGKTFVMKGFCASASGKIKLDFQSGTTSQIVAFNSTANPNIFIEFAQPIEFASTIVMHPIITNLEASSMDVYITYWGVEV